MGLTRLALLAFPVLLAAQEPAAAPAKPEDLCSIEGQVLHSLTGEPVRKARIVMNNVDGRNNIIYSVVTDAGGRFVIQDIEPGRYLMFTERNGFIRAEYGARANSRSGTQLSLIAGQHMRDVLFRLVPQALIAGRVLDEDGEPVERVQVTIMRYARGRGKRQFMPAGGDTTDDLGEYRVFGLEPGKYYLSATYGQQMMSWAKDRTAGGASDEGYAPTYFPGTNDPAAAVPIELKAGAQHRGADITLRKTRTVKIRGRVTSAPGGSLPGNLTLTLVTKDRLSGFSAEHMTRVENRDGTFELRGVTPGAYILIAQWWDEGKNFHVAQPVDVGDSNVENASLLLSPGLDLKGQVRVEGAAELNLASLQVVLAPLAVPFGWLFAKASDEGGFTVPGVSSDTYTVNVQGMPADFFVKSVRMGEADGLEGLDLTRGGPGALEILLSPNGGQVEGSVLDSNQQPAAEALVTLAPDARRREQPQFFKAARTDASGHFIIKGIAPGDYKLFAWNQTDNVAFDDPEFLKDYENQGEAVALREGGRETRQLKVIPMDTGAKN